MTRQRALILGIMREKCPEHLTADEIFSHARQAMPHIARGTVYRNLKLMELDGEIGHLEMPDGPDRYDANPTPHGHLLCDSCGDLADLQIQEIARRCGYTDQHYFSYCFKKYSGTSPVALRRARAAGEARP